MASAERGWSVEITLLAAAKKDLALTALRRVPTGCLQPWKALASSSGGGRG